MEEIMDTQNLAESVLSKMSTRTSPCERQKPVRVMSFRSSFAFARQPKVKMDYNMSITDDSGFIPFEKEMERFVTSGKVYEQYMRMAFPNGSADKVAEDYQLDFGAMSKADAIRFIESHKKDLQMRLNARVSNARVNNVETVNNENENPEVNQPTEA